MINFVVTFREGPKKTFILVVKILPPLRVNKFTLMDILKMVNFLFSAPIKDFYRFIPRSRNDVFAVRCDGH